MKKKLSTLVKEMEFNHITEYFDYLIDCHTNGNFESCERLFSEMRKEDQKALLRYMNEECNPNRQKNDAKAFYFNLL